jgi:ATP-dependent Clp protease ATP-binding subunit ClpB
LSKLQKDLGDLQEKSDEMTANWQAERDKLEGARELKEQLDRARADVDIATREGNLARAGELRFGVIPELEKKLAAAEASEGDMTVEEAVRPEHVAQVIERWTGIPAGKMLEGDRDKLLADGRRAAQARYWAECGCDGCGQCGAPCACGAERRGATLGSFLFLGPTGVGKTELTKAVAEFLFDDDNAMVRIDMSEFMEKHAVSRLIGAPPGYVGYDEGGVLTEAVRRRPYQVVLFDEVEKAHPDVFNVLLQVLDDGVLTDGQGRTVDFKQTLIILTSNLGAQALSQLPEGLTRVTPSATLWMLSGAFPPEFLNRLDETIIFDRLGREDMGGIVEIQLARLKKRLLARKIELDLDEGAMKWLADEGYDPVFGARPLKRVIQRALQNPLAEALLAGDIKDGDTIPVRAGAEGLLIGDRVGATNRDKPDDAVVH